MQKQSLRRLTAGGVLALAVAAAGTAHASGGYDQPKTIRLVEAHATAEPAFVDVGKPGPSVGDMAVVSDGLNREDGTHAGDFHQVCTLVTLADSPLTSGYECSGTIALANGTITQQGSFTPATPDQLAAVSGGTGAYRTARGDIEIQAEADRLTIRLRQCGCSPPPVVAGGRDSSASDVMASSPRAASSSTELASSGERA